MRRRERSRDCGTGGRADTVAGEGDAVATQVEAQIAGTVWKIEKRVGESVSEGDVLLILESMKMEIPVESEVAGRIAELRVEEGDSVEEGAVLVVIE